MAIVVSDASPIIALAQLKHLELLRDLFSEVLIPPAVEAELTQGQTGLPIIDVSQLPFVRIQAPQDQGRVGQLRMRLDPGESEALALALEVQADLVLIDEELGRTVAKELGLTPLGTLGMLVEAKRRGAIARITPLLDRLENELSFFMSREIRAEILRLASE